MKRCVLICLILGSLVFLPGCSKEEFAPAGTTLNVKINIDYAGSTITIHPPVPDPAKVRKGAKVNWVVTVTPDTRPLDVTIDKFADTSGKAVDVFGDGSSYRIGGAASGQSATSGAAAVVSAPEGFKYEIRAVSSTGDKQTLDPRIIVSAASDH